MKTKVEVIEGDITKMHTDAIVNAANSSLLGGGGEDGAIHRAAGPQLLEECRAIGGCPTGEARITKGYNLLAKFVIHTVGPVWNGGKNGEAEKLASCYYSSLLLAKENKIETIAFPSISTGIYGYPVEQAAEVAIQTINEFSRNNTLPKKVYMVCFDPNTYKAYQRAVDKFAEQV